VTQDARTIDDLLRIMAALRTPGSGCPWDLEQTYSTIAPYTIEEAYEVSDAIERKDFEALKDELGDLLLQVVYHARMAQEDERFAFYDVVAAICDKMVRRHPHVFGNEEEKKNFVPEGFWERMKAQEKAGQQTDKESLPASAFDDVPLALPALTRALKLQDKAAKVGFDWPDMEPVFDKLREEVGELEDATNLENPSRKKIAEELGDMLFMMANLARHMRIDPEDALRQANAKFVRRFQEIEKKLAADRRTPSQSTLAEMDRLWDEAKDAEEPPE
jgi:MazG family protein